MAVTICVSVNLVFFIVCCFKIRDILYFQTNELRGSLQTEIKKQIEDAFTEIAIDEHGDYYFQYFDSNSGKTQTLWSGKNGKSLERYRTRRGKDKNEIITEPYNLKNLLDNLFSNFDKSTSLLEQLKTGKTLTKIRDKETAWESLRFVIDLIQQIRNSGDIAKGQDDNFLLSPIRNNRGDHFDSRIVTDNLPKDADANGAYNIARKGIIMFEHIKQWVKDGKRKNEKGTDLDLFVSDREWDLWLNNRNEWEYQLSVFSSQKAKVKLSAKV